MFSGNREIWVLQTMLLLNVTGNHLGKRVDHEMSDILQGTMVTVSEIVCSSNFSSPVEIVSFSKITHLYSENEIRRMRQNGKIGYEGNLSNDLRISYSSMILNIPAYMVIRA